MQCKACKYPHSEVVKTRHDDYGNIIRRRACLRCGFRYTTQEEVKKKDNNEPNFYRAIGR